MGSRSGWFRLVQRKNKKNIGGSISPASFPSMCVDFAGEGIREDPFILVRSRPRHGGQRNSIPWEGRCTRHLASKERTR
jgi:hypothetical protein